MIWNVLICWVSITFSRPRLSKFAKIVVSSLLSFFRNWTYRYYRIVYNMFSVNKYLCTVHVIQRVFAKIYLSCLFGKISKFSIINWGIISIHIHIDYSNKNMNTIIQDIKYKISTIKCKQLQSENFVNKLNWFRVKIIVRISFEIIERISNMSIFKAGVYDIHEFN